MKKLAKRLLAATPYRLVARDALNRFQAVEESIEAAHRRGYRPRVIVDGGANTGAFSQAMLNLFPDAVVHAVEPQPGCTPALTALQTRTGGRLRVHAVALCAPEEAGGTLNLAGDAQSTSTGAHIMLGGPGTKPSVPVPCMTLDSVVGPCAASDRVLIKLDLQGFELNALKGATATLAAAELVLTEVSFFAQAYEPPIAELVAFLDRQGFELYDVASISARRRDGRAKQGDFLFARRGSPLVADTAWS